MTVPSILARQSQEELADFIHHDPLLAFDFDGVLAPIVVVRQRANIHVRTRALLQDVARRYDTIVVSGRALADLTPRLEGIPFRMAFGNFGYEPAAADAKPPALVAEWVSALSERLPRGMGLFVEDKRYSVAVHYRHAEDPVKARHLIERVVRDFPGVRVLDGTKAVTLLPLNGPDKGSTIQGAARRLRRNRVVYAGDDGTDEDAFRSAGPERLLSIRVGAARQTSARFRLSDQAELDELLESILAMSTPESAPRAPRAAHRW